MRIMKNVVITILIVSLLCLIVIPAIFIIFGLESDPLVVSGNKLTIDDAKRVKQLLRDNDPRKLKSGEIKTVAITERDLNLFLDYASSHSPRNENLSAHVELYPESANGQLTYRLPENPFGTYLNLSVVASQASQSLAVEKLKVGSLVFPHWFLNPVAGYFHRYFQRYEEYRDILEAVQAIENIELQDKRVSVTYQWQPDVMRQLQARGRDFFIPADEQARLWFYYEQVAIISHTLKKRSVSITGFLAPLFQLAEDQSLANGDPAAENRALILALTIYSTGRNAEKFLGTKNSKMSQSPKRVRLSLLGRGDLALHFLFSAAIAVAAGSGLANLAGLFKEMDDSHGGSGFSFADLAADRAGVRLAEQAIASPGKAILLQQRMSQALNESDFMPQIKHLPEGIMELEFKRKYQDLDSASYRIVDREIERRIESCRIYTH